jgi:hypothetical protein
MAKEKRHYATEEEINDLMVKNKWDRQEAEFYLIDKYNEVIFPDETDEVITDLKKNLKNANVYDNKKGKVKRERKPDDDKRELTAKLVDLFQNYDDFSVVSEEGKLKFVYNNRHFTVTLTWNRKEDKIG